ncbi:MAG: NUDIX domain-containing protein [Anaerolineae bacterium]|nr:NUDIX domain-containing protein [Anaerolineae bacterium]
MRVANFCPICGATTTMRERFGKARPVCSQCNHTIFFEPKVAVVVFVTNDEHVLLVQRANDPARGTWALPAGFVDPDEDPRAAARREILEETGLTVEIKQLIDVLHRPDANGLADIVIAFRAEVIGGQLNAGDDAADAGWFARTELPEIGFKTTEILLSSWSKIDGR